MPQDRADPATPAPGAIFTTRGWLPAQRVRLVDNVVEEDDDRRVIRRDKYDLTDNAWVGNDLHIDIKRLPPLLGQAGAFA